MNHLDLFAGIGGFSLTARWMGWKTIAQVEWDEWCQKVLAKNFPDALRFGDIKQFNDGIESFFTNGKCLGWTEGAGQNLQQQEQITKRQDIGNFCKEIRLRGRIDIITGGFPCQPFSHAGKRQGVADERYLWPEMLRTIRILKPSFVVGENVAGLVSMDGGKTLDAILADLENEGYTVESFIIPACAVGAWHRRDRIWIVAHSVNSTDRADRGQGREKESIQGYRGEAGLSREFSGASSEILADTNNGRFKEQRLNKSIQSDIEREAEGIESEYSGGCNGRELKARTGQLKSELGRMVNGIPLELDGYWNREPDGIPRVATGVKNRVDRLKGLGNAIVPQIALQLFKAIAEYKNI
jgi:DNA (cytosine-5)-methyltransferase 1